MVVGAWDQCYYPQNEDHVTGQKLNKFCVMGGGGCTEADVISSCSDCTLFPVLLANKPNVFSLYCKYHCIVECGHPSGDNQLLHELPLFLC